MAKAALSALILGALCARGIASCTDDETPIVPPMGYDQQVCLSIASPIDGSCFALSDPATQTIPVTLELNSTFALRPPGSCSTNALNNCGHAIFYVNGQCAARSASLLTDISLADVAQVQGKVTITALLVDDCDDPWTLEWNDAGVVEDGGIMCLGPDAGPDAGSTITMGACPASVPPDTFSRKVTNTCPENGSLDAGTNAGPYFASVTINVQPSCPTRGAGAGGAATSSTSTSSAGMGGAATSSVTTVTTSTSSSGMGGAITSSATTATTSVSTSSSGMGGASTSSGSSSTSGTGGAATTTTTTSTASGMGGASTSASGTGGAAPADAGDGG